MANFKTAWNAFWSIFKSDELAQTWKDIVANPQPALPPAEIKSEATEKQEEATSPVKSTLKGEAVHALAIRQVLIVVLALVVDRVEQVLQVVERNTTYILLLTIRH